MNQIFKQKKIKILFKNIELLNPHEYEGLTMIKGGKLAVDIEGYLMIYINEKIFFHEECILLVELAKHLHRWMQKIELNLITDFYYESMDYEDKPILHFVNKEKYWQIYSVWEQFSSEDKLSTEDILCSARQYITDLKYELKNHFNLDIAALFSYLDIHLCENIRYI